MTSSFWGGTLNPHFLTTPPPLPLCDDVIYQHKGGQLSTLWYTEKKSDSVTAKLIFIQNYFESELNFKSLGRAFSQLGKCAKWSRHSFACWNERQKIFHRFQRTFLVEQRARAASTNSLAAITCLLTQTIPWRQNVSSCGNLYLATAVNRIMLFWKSAKYSKNMASSYHRPFEVLKISAASLSKFGGKLPS